MSDNPRAVVLLSGGLDSTTLAYQLKSEGYDLHALAFNYGQRHKRELLAARDIALKLGAPFDIIDLSDLGKHLTGSALTDLSVAVPHGHYEAESMKLTIVPNRNAIMLSIAFGVAAAEGAKIVAIAVHAGDHAVYPDCRPEFIVAFDDMEEAALPGGPGISAPFLGMSKTDIARLAHTLDVPIEATWSCYEGGATHCGRCGTCVERIQALHEACVPDLTEYACDTSYALSLA